MGGPKHKEKVMNRHLSLARPGRRRPPEGSNISLPSVIPAYPPPTLEEKVARRKTNDV
jgi:hypothetical protein